MKKMDPISTTRSHRSFIHGHRVHSSARTIIIGNTTPMPITTILPKYPWVHYPTINGYVNVPKTTNDGFVDWTRWALPDFTALPIERLPTAPPRILHLSYFHHRPTSPTWMQCGECNTFMDSVQLVYWLTHHPTSTCPCCHKRITIPTTLFQFEVTTTPMKNIQIPDRFDLYL